MLCRKCGYEWDQRKANPKVCPRCKAWLDIPHNRIDIPVIRPSRPYPEYLESRDLSKIEEIRGTELYTQAIGYYEQLIKNEVFNNPGLGSHSVNEVIIRIAHQLYDDVMFPVGEKQLRTLMTVHADLLMKYTKGE